MSTLTRTARLTGLAYLGLAISGMLAYLLIRQQLYVPDDAVATASNLVEHTSLARLGVALDVTVVLTQALAALGFLALFRRVHAVAAGAIAAFGLVNATLIMVATAFSATALEVALSSGDDGAAAHLLYQQSGALWDLGSLFFGLWLIPMGWCVLRSGYMPRPLGWILVVAGIGYVLSTYVAALAPETTVAATALTLPATVGEFWMVGYLLSKGVRQTAPQPRTPSLVDA